MHDADDRKLRDIVAGFWKIRPGDVTDDLQFDAVHLQGMTSLRFYRFIAAVESNFRIRLTDTATITSYGVLRETVQAVRAA